MDAWCRIARDGLCTMGPAVGKWVRMRLGMEPAPFRNGNVMSLNAMISGLVPKDARPHAPRHTAGCDAHFHVLIYRALAELADTPPCL